ncbi:hypothetical protein [Flexibacterium corallicola]|uniref:hypothetical protein n=1 Tax=Flexibacterium corallicola TaxID=3037259 RepID=UPI00286F5EE0|nr:hypothetical protein [Pseudovibrio sp. M1P-2-3]
MKSSHRPENLHSTVPTVAQGAACVAFRKYTTRYINFPRVYLEGPLSVHSDRYRTACHLLHPPSHSRPLQPYHVSSRQGGLDPCFINVDNAVQFLLFFGLTHNLPSSGVSGTELNSKCDGVDAPPGGIAMCHIYD